MFYIKWPKYNKKQVKFCNSFLHEGNSTMKRQWKLCFRTPVFVYSTEVTVLHIQSKNKRLEVADILARFTLQMLKSRSCLDWQRSSRRLESWEGLLFAINVSTICAEAIFRVNARWLSNRLSKRQLQTTVLLRTPTTQMIFFNQGMLLRGSKHFLNQNHLRVTITPISGVSNSVSNIAAALRIRRVFPRGSCRETIKAIQFSRPGLRIGKQS